MLWCGLFDYINEWEIFDVNSLLLISLSVQTVT
jgi:hypothetical protein